MLFTIRTNGVKPPHMMCYASEQHVRIIRMLGKDKEIDALLPLQRCVKHLFYMFLGELHRERTLITKELKGTASNLLCPLIPTFL